LEQSEYLVQHVPRTVKTVMNGAEVTLSSTDPRDFVPAPVLDEHGKPVRNPEYEKNRRPLLVYAHIGAFEGRFAGTVTGSEIVAQRRVSSSSLRMALAPCGEIGAGIADPFEVARQRILLASHHALRNALPGVRALHAFLIGHAPKLALRPDGTAARSIPAIRQHRTVVIPLRRISANAFEAAIRRSVRGIIAGRSNCTR